MQTNAYRDFASPSRLERRRPQSFQAGGVVGYGENNSRRVSLSQRPAVMLAFYLAAWILALENAIDEERRSTEHRVDAGATIGPHRYAQFCF
jgi:hypothetical protein